MTTPGTPVLFPHPGRPVPHPGPSGGGTITTGQCPWWAHAMLTEPITIPLNPPRPREPTTRSRACCAASTRARAAWPSTRCVEMCSSGAALRASSRLLQQVARELLDVVTREHGHDRPVVGDGEDRRVLPRVHEHDGVAVRARLVQGPLDGALGMLRAVDTDHDHSGHAHVVRPRAWPRQGRSSHSPAAGGPTYALAPSTPTWSPPSPSTAARPWSPARPWGSGARPP